MLGDFLTNNKNSLHPTALEAQRTANAQDAGNIGGSSLDERNNIISMVPEAGFCFISGDVFSFLGFIVIGFLLVFLLYSGDFLKVCLRVLVFFKVF